MYSSSAKFSLRRSGCCPECGVRFRNLNRQAKTIDSCGHLKCQHCAGTRLLKCSQCEKEKERQYVLDSSQNHAGQKLTYWDFGQRIQATLLKDTVYSSVREEAPLKSGTIPEAERSLDASEDSMEPEPLASRSARVQNERRQIHEIVPIIAPSSRTRSVARAKRQIRKSTGVAIPPQKKRKSLPNVEVDGKRQCPICKKLFSLNSNFGRHVSLHTGGKKFKCEPCNKEYSRNENWVRHQRSKIHIRKLQIENGN